MIFKDYIKTAFSNLKKRKLRTFLTSFAVSIGAMLVIIMVSLGVGIKNMAVDSLEQQASVREVNVGTVQSDDKKTSKDKDKKVKLLNEKGMDDIRKIDNVTDVKGLLYTYASGVKIDGNKGNATQLTGYDLKYSVVAKQEIDGVKSSLKEKKKKGTNIKEESKVIIAGRMLKNGDKDKILVNEDYLKNLKITDYKSVVGKEIELSLSNGGKEISFTSAGSNNDSAFKVKGTIVGVVNKEYSSNGSIIMPIAMAANIQGFYENDPLYLKNKGIQSAVVFIDKIDRVNPVAKEIKNMGFSVETLQSVIDIVKKVFNVLEGILAIGGIIVLFVASIGVINTMIMSIYERTRSIGIMKAVGASNKDIRRMFIFESGALGLIGGVMGLIFGWIGIGILRFALNVFLKSKGSDSVDLFSMPLWLVLGTLAFSIFISVVAGLYPASRAAKLDPMESLRYE